jgi:hypothetical protein
MFIRRLLMTIIHSALMIAPVTVVRAADHLDAPLLRNPGQGGRDINDVYVFQSPSNPANSVLVMTVNPFAAMVNPAGTVSLRTFDPAVEYQLQVDNNGDAVADVTYAATFTAPVGGVQMLTMNRNGAAFAAGSTEANIPISGGGTLRAALFEDPFFFDLVGFNRRLGNRVGGSQLGPGGSERGRLGAHVSRRKPSRPHGPARDQYGAHRLGKKRRFQFGAAG